jgi:glucose/arabinose dehydrogenase
MNRPIQPPVLFVCLLLLGLLTAGLLLHTGNRQADTAAALTSSPYLNVSLVNVADGFDQPTAIAHAGDGRLFIAEQAGLIRIIGEDGSVLPAPFLDIQDQVGTSFYEQGLLGLAFHPDYTNNGYFYIYYNDLNGDSQVVRYTAEDEDENTADPDSAFPIISIEQPYENNNGGSINFGPDGYLYIALGDGGGTGDPDNMAQDGTTLLGKLLRLDVDGTTAETNYQIPADNPFVGNADVLDEIWALGLRNPWRFSFDAATGDLYLADVGLIGYEEINFQPADSSGGENYGWRCYEGHSEHNLDGCGPEDLYTFPIHAFAHWENGAFLGCSVTGGYVYRGHWSPALIGHYIFGDYCSGNFWSLVRDDEGEWQINWLGELLPNVSSFGEGANGELYAAGHGDGTIYRLKVEPTTPDVSVSAFATGLSQPLGIVNSGIAGDERLFIVQKSGLIRIVQGNGSVLPTPFLDISNLVSGGSEQGLLGLAFHPEYGENGYFFVNYTDTGGNTQIVRYRVNPTDPNVADPDSALTVLSVTQPLSNHNGGNLEFGPDGYLYIGLGDGGGSGDPGNYGQNMASLLGKMLRIDPVIPTIIPPPDPIPTPTQQLYLPYIQKAEGEVAPPPYLDPDCGSGNYFIPADNPFVEDTPDTCNEIWAAGLRNPWRFSFDRLLGDLYIADVGQNAWEEVNWQPASSPGGENYGWRCYEGNHPYNLTGCGPAELYTFPIHEYNHSQGDRSITGGSVYRGSDYPALWGHYLFGDYMSGRFWALHPDGDGGWQIISFGSLLGNFSLSSFGEDINGELYASHLGNGTIYRIQENSSP